MGKKFCPHCGPLAVNHFVSWLENFLNYFFDLLDERFCYLGGRKIWRWRQKIEEAVWNGFLFLFEKFKIISFCDMGFFDRSKVYNRTLIFLDEAKKCGFRSGAVLILGRHNNQFFIEIDGPLRRSSSEASRKIFFEGLPLGRTDHNHANRIFIDDKAKIKKILRANVLPYAKGQSFWRAKKAYAYGLNLGWPLVVKPRFGSISRHVFININDTNALKQAIAATKKICPQVVVEKYLPGISVFRATMINFKLGGVVKRIPANVLGDGAHTVRELAEIKNNDPRRGRPKQKDCTYLKIIIDETSQELLAKQELNLDSVPDNGRTVFLQEKIILDLGADLIEVTDKVHADNIDLFERTARIFGSKVVGIDFLCADIAISWRDQSCAIIELNSLPFIDMHHFPLVGQPRNIAGMILDMIEEEYL